MGHIQLNIENQKIDFEITTPGKYFYDLDGITRFIEVEEVREKGFTFKVNEHSSQSYWWDIETRPYLVCSLCGELYQAAYLKNKGRVEKEMRDKHFCFSCGHWTALIGDKEHFIIDGMCYALGPGNSGGMAGRKFQIEFADGKSVTTNDLWCQGEVPEHFRKYFPDNAKFMGGAYFDREVRAWQQSR